MRIEITRSIREQHVAAYGGALNRALEALSEGCHVPWRHSHSIGVSDADLKECDVRHLFDTLRKQQGKVNGLLIGCVESLLGAMKRIEPIRKIVRNRSSASAQRCDDQMRQLFCYEKFVGNEHLAYMEKEDAIEYRSGEWGSRAFLRQLGVRACPYCNAEPIHISDSNQANDTVNSLDHYFDKAKFPYLALSLYNMIPVCRPCNEERRRKLDKMSAEKYAHPYRESMHHQLAFTVKIKNWRCVRGIGMPDDAELELRQQQGVQRSVQALALLHGMGIDSLYRQDYFDETLKTLGIIGKMRKERKLVLTNKFPGIQEAKAYRQYFMQDLSEDKINVTRFSKLKLDLIREMKPLLGEREKRSHWKTRC